MVRQAPGGNSSICLGTDDLGGAPMGQSNNVFASDANPNSGNFMTDRPSTRVVQKPGGSSTCPFATDENVSMNASRRRGPVGGQSTVRLGDDCTDREEQRKAEALSRGGSDPRAQPEERAAGMRVPSRYNGTNQIEMRAQAESNTGSEPEQKRRVPPGGFSSIQFG